MRRNIFAVVALIAVALALPTSAKERYNVWAKEKIRYHHNRVQQNPYNAQLRVLLANAYFSDGDYHEAVVQLQKALELESDYPEAHCNLGIVRHAQSMLVEAEEHYREALRLDSTLVDAMAGLGTMMCASGRRAEGIDFLEGTLAYDARRDDARFNLAVAYHKVGDYPAAIGHLEYLHRRSPGYAGVNDGLAKAYFARGLTMLQAELPAEALVLLHKAEGLNLRSANVYYAEGLAQMALDSLTAAGAAFGAAIELDEDHVPALHNLAQVLDLQGRTTEAEAYYLRVARLTPHMATIDAARNASYDEKILLK